MGAFATALQGIARPYVPNWTATYEGINALRDLQARNATAGIYRQSIDPNTGAFDQGRFNALVGQSPEASWRAGEAMQQAGTAMTTQGTGAQQQFAAQQQRLVALSGLATPTMLQWEQHPEQANMAALTGLVDQARRANLMTDADVQQAKTLMAQPGANPLDILRGWYFRNFTAQQQLAAGGTENYDVGPYTLRVPTTPGTPGYPGAGTVYPKGLTPSQQVTPLDIRMSDGSIQQVLPAEAPAFLGQHPGAFVVGPSASGPVTVPGFGSGRYPKPTAAPGAPAAPPAPTTPSLTVGPPPQPVAGRGPPLGAEAAATGSVAQATGMGGLAGASPQRQAILSDMESSLTGKDQLNTGPGSEWAHAWSAVVNRLPDNLSSLIPGMTRDQVASYEGFGKMAEQLRQQQSQQIGGALTNDKFASALASNPHQALSTLGNLGMIHILQGNEDAITAKNNAWQKSVSEGWQPKDFLAWERQYNATPAADPRIYWLQHMSPDERKKFVTGMSADQQARLKQNYNLVFPKPAAPSGP